MWAFIWSPTRPFSHAEVLMCGCLAARPHTSFQRTQRGWCVGVYQFVHTPVSSLTPKAISCHVFCRVHDNCPSMLVSRWQLSLYPNMLFCHVFFVVLHGNCIVFSRWQLLKIPPRPHARLVSHTQRCQLPCVLQGTWQLS